MKKITFLFFILFTISNYATIIEKNITDYTFNTGGLLDFDFNSDGISEFIFEETGGTVGCFFNPSDVNFVGTGSLSSGHGWDIIKSLSFNTLINNASMFDAQGDAYINPMWSDTDEIFPVGDSYIGVKFKIGSNIHFGWILVNSTGGDSGTITIKSYAYETIANQGIFTGQILNNLSFNNFTVSIYPIPSSDIVQFISDKNIISVILFDTTGKIINLDLNNNSVNISNINPGIYLLKITSETNESSLMRIIKN